MTRQPAPFGTVLTAMATAFAPDGSVDVAATQRIARHLVDHGRRVFVDAEHFFDGYAFDPDTSLRVLDAAAGAGADVVVLCDTNGGQLPLQLRLQMG